MLNRRLIRVKVFKVLFSRIHSGDLSLEQAGKELMFSFEKTYELYWFLLALPVALREAARERIEIGKAKFHPTEAEAHPNMRFVENKAIAILDGDPAIAKALRHTGLSWNLQETYIRRLYRRMPETDYFRTYMEAPSEPDLKEDIGFLVDFYASELEDDPDLNSLLEDLNVYWADDLAYCLNQVIRTLTSPAFMGAAPVHPPLFKEEEDKEYALYLLRESIKHYADYAHLIDKAASNWDLERVAATDLALIVMGVTEAVVFPEIPVKVTINEAVEISKYYSTSGSKSFVNGVLDKIIADLKAQGLIVKTGRGLKE